VILSEDGNIISEARNQISEFHIPNPRLLHAEVEALRNLDIKKYPNLKEYTLYAGLEPCPMCLGTFAMSGLRKIVIATRDDFGGSMNLAQHSPFMKRKNFEITFLDNELGDMQRAFQIIRELLYNADDIKLGRILADFSVYNKRGVDAACALVKEGYFEGKNLSDITAGEVFDKLAERIK
jgi:tRNA(Arg) A34 adenosine deaminase TadA